MEFRQHTVHTQSQVDGLFDRITNSHESSENSYGMRLLDLRKSIL